MTNDIKKIVQRLKESILLSGYTYAELEKLTGISRSSLQRYANGITLKIPIDAIQAVAKAVGVEAEYIMGWDNNDKIKSDILQLTKHEQTVITAYRNKPEMQPAVDKLLGVNEDTELIPSLVAARSKNNDEPIHFENLPDLSKFPVDDTEL